MIFEKNWDEDILFRYKEIKKDFEKVIITKGDVVTYSGLLRKYGYDKYEVLRESIKTLYNAEKEETIEA